MRTVFIRKLGVGSVGKFLGIATAIWIFVAGIFALFGTLAVVLAQSDWSVWSKLWSSLGAVFVSLVFLPALGLGGGR